MTKSKHVVSTQQSSLHYLSVLFIFQIDPSGEAARVGGIQQGDQIIQVGLDL